MQGQGDLGNVSVGGREMTGADFETLLDAALGDKAVWNSGWPQESGSSPCFSGFGVSRIGLMRACLSGGDAARNRIAMELVLRGTEAGEVYIIVDMNGFYSPLIDYIPSLRVYRVGSYVALNPFVPCGDAEEFAGVISSAVQDFYGLMRDERVYFEKALVSAYSANITEPTAEDLRDRLLQIEAEAQPKECYKIESLRNVLWELETGALGKVLARKGRLEPRIPALFDLSAVRAIKGKALLALYVLLRAIEWGATTVLIDPADWLLRTERGSAKDMPEILEGCMGNLSNAGVALQLCTSAPSSLPDWANDSLTARLYCGPVWERDLSSIERAFLLEYRHKKEIRHLEGGSVLMCVAGFDTPRILKPSQSKFRQVSDADVTGHMRALGESIERLEASVKGLRLLEKVFTERGKLVYAIEVMKLVKGGRVPVDAVARHKNNAVRHVMKGLRRYFLVIEYTDNSGSSWYKLTKAGERALAEMDVDGDAAGGSSGSSEGSECKDYSEDTDEGGK
jgi:hypothetical protein